MTQFVWLRVWPPLAIGRRGLAPQCSPALIVLITPMSVHSLSAFCSSRIDFSPRSRPPLQ